jgi:hypothetical protein
MQQAERGCQDLGASLYRCIAQALAYFHGKFTRSDSSIRVS